MRWPGQATVGACLGDPLWVPVPLCRVAWVSERALLLPLLRRLSSQQPRAPSLTAFSLLLQGRLLARPRRSPSAVRPSPACHPLPCLRTAFPTGGGAPRRGEGLTRSIAAVLAVPAGWRTRAVQFVESTSESAQRKSGQVPGFLRVLGGGGGQGVGSHCPGCLRLFFGMREDVCDSEQRPSVAVDRYLCRGH